MNYKNSLTLLALLFISVTTFSQDKKAEPKAKEAKTVEAKDAAGQPSPEDMKKWGDYMTPGDMHKMLASSDGDWNEEVTFWMAPGGPPTKNQSTCTNKMIMGGRYQESIHSGMMEGMPFEGKGTLAYDNLRKVFLSTWIDNWGTGMMYMEGKYDPATKTISFSGKCVDPLVGKEVPVRETFKIIDDKTQKMEMFMTKNGKEFKNMEIVFTRK